MGNNVNIDTNTNNVNVLSSDNNIAITTETKVVNVTEEVNKVIKVITRGPQGPKGDSGGGGGTDLNALTTASIADSTITFTKGSGDQFIIEVNNVVSAQTASYILADNIKQPFTSVEAISLTGSLDYSYIKDVPDFVDTTGDIAENQIAIFAETFNGIPESLPFSIPLENDSHPTIKGVGGLTYDGSTFKVQGIITGSNIPPNLINLKGNAQPNQLVRFTDTTDTELPIPLPFYVPVNDGNPTVEAVSGLSMVGNSLNVEGNISASGDLTANEYYIDVAKVLFAEDGQFKFGNTGGPGTVVEGSSITLNANVTVSSSISASGAIQANNITASAISGFISNDGDNRILTSNGNGTLTAESGVLITDSSFIVQKTTVDFQTNIFNIEGAITNFDTEVTIDGVNGHITSSGDINASGTGSFNYMILPNLPTSDPGVAGAVFRSGNDLKISTG